MIKMAVKGYIIVFLLLLMHIPTYANRESDSLINLIEQTPKDTNLVDLFNSISWSLKYSNPDSSILFAEKGRKLAKYLGYGYGESQSLSNIGVAYDVLGKYDKSLQYFEEALKTYNYKNDKDERASIITNIATLYSELGNIEKSNSYYRKAIVLFTELEDYFSLSDCYTSLGGNCKKAGKLDDAIKYLLKAKMEKERIKDNRGLAFTLIHLAKTRLSQARKVKNNSYLLADAIKYANDGLAFAEELNLLPLKRDALETLFGVYDYMDNSAKALEFHKKFVAIKDSIINSEKLSQIAELETQYQSEKKALQIKNLEKEKTLQADINKRQQRWISIIIIAAIIVFIFAVISYRLYLGKKRYSELLILRNQKIMTQKNEIENHKDTMYHHRGEIVFQNKHITQSIKYAKRIQDSILPDITPLKEQFQDFFHYLLAQRNCEWRFLLY